MNGPPHMLEAYLDGLLQGEERAAFLPGLEQDSALAGQVALQRRIDASLSRLFIAPAGGDLRVLAADARAPRKARPLRVGVLAVAAIIGLVAVGALQFWSEFRVRHLDRRYPPKPWRGMAQVYEETVARGFKPNWVCKDDEEFATAFRRRLGQGLAVLSPPPGIAWAGVDYTNTISSLTMTVLAHVHGEKVIVFADRKARDKAATLPPGSTLHAFRGEAGDLVLYEVTPHPRPFLLDLFFIPGVRVPPKPP
jgi:hypothetical protein